MVIPGQPTYPFQWEAVMDNGLTAFIENGEQSDARRLPCPIRELRIKGFNMAIPFAIPIPLGAEPVIYRDGEMQVSGGNYGPGDLKVEHMGFTHIYGWEKDGEVSLWEFGQKPPVHKTER